jgi:hypothetical protein
MHGCGLGAALTSTSGVPDHLKHLGLHAKINIDKQKATKQT